MVKKKIKIVQDITETYTRQIEGTFQVEAETEDDIEDIVDRIKDRISEGYTSDTRFESIAGVSVIDSVFESDSECIDSESTFDIDEEDIEDDDTEPKTIKQQHPSWF